MMINSRNRSNKQINDEIEKKLARYRAHMEVKSQQNFSFKKYFTSFFPRKQNEPENEALLLTHINEEVVAQNNTPSIDSDSDSIETDSCFSCGYVYWFYYILCFSLWATVYIIFIQMQFGTVYLITSGLIGIYFNTRTGPKEEGEISAYSVFNKDCKSIDGTLKAEQFEREIRYGPAVVRS